MDRDGLDLSELSAFADELLEIAQESPKKVKKFLRQEGGKLAKATKARAMQDVGRDHKKPAQYANSKHYVDTIKRGRVYRYHGDFAIRAYSTARHAHLIEYGHLLKSHGNSVGFVPGKLIFDKSMRTFASRYVSDADKFCADIAEEIER